MAGKKKTMKGGALTMFEELDEYFKKITKNNPDFFNRKFLKFNIDNYFLYLSEILEHELDLITDLNSRFIKLLQLYGQMELVLKKIGNIQNSPRLTDKIEKLKVLMFTAIRKIEKKILDKFTRLRNYSEEIPDIDKLYDLYTLIMKYHHVFKYDGLENNSRKSYQIIQGIYNRQKQKTQQPQFQNNYRQQINSSPNNNSNFNRILEGLKQRYPQKVSDFGNLPTLAFIASKIKSIKKMADGYNRTQQIIKLQDKIDNFKKTLGNYTEFQKYESNIDIISAQ